jgi:hypothetical protein
MASAVIISGGTPLFYEVIQYMATKQKQATKDNEYYRYSGGGCFLLLVFFLKYSQPSFGGDCNSLSVHCSMNRYFFGVLKNNINDLVEYNLKS